MWAIAVRIVPGLEDTSLRVIAGISADAAGGIAPATHDHMPPIFICVELARSTVMRYYAGAVPTLGGCWFEINHEYWFEMLAGPRPSSSFIL
jgi:hypothetical protein